MTVIRFQPKSEGILCEAIRKRRLLAFNYGDGERVLEPYVHGLNSDGAGVLRAYQISGPSKLGHSNPWRLFQVDRTTDLRILDDHFAGDRDDFNPHDPDIARVHCQVASGT